jgi:predicted dinucleotide-binding enzyme
MKKIGIIGSGVVGKTLASGFLKHGYEVTIGTRDLNKLSEWKTNNPKGNIGSFEDAAKFGELLVVCTKGHATESAIKLAGLGNFKGKTVIDTTNPIDESKPPVNGVLKYYTTDKSQLELIQALIPEANLVKAFNCIGGPFMVDPNFAEGKPTMFICGNSDEAKQDVTKILEQFGFDVYDSGKAESGGALESLCILWCAPGLLKNDWTHAFRMLRK